jgi:hypothetical protein
MRKLTFGMNLSLDGYIAAPGDDLGWSVPSDELFQWWSDRVGATGLALYGRKLWETMSSHWPTAAQQPGATPAQIEFARRWRDMPKVSFRMASASRESVFGVQTSTARKIHRSDHTEGRLTTAPSGCCVRKGTRCGHSASIWRLVAAVSAPGVP